jgi:uncharacterized membrane protein (DUF485 family)
MTDIVRWFYDPAKSPDYKQIVEKSISLFAVFTGATLSFYIGDFLFANKLPDEFMAFPFWSRACLVAAVIALLLRYIVGSAVHLNLMYVPKARPEFVEIIERDDAGHELRYFAIREPTEPESTSLWRLFFDLVVLVVFGILAVSIIHARDLQEFLSLAAWFVFAGFLWGVFAFLLRPEDREIAKRWMVIDIVQAAVTVILLIGVWHGWDKLPTTAVLAALYVFFLLVDLAVVSRPPQIEQQNGGAAAPLAAL